MSFSSMLNNTCAIYRQTASFDVAMTEFGEIIENWELVYSGIACRLDISLVPISLERGGLIELGTRMLYTENATDIQKNDKIYVNALWWSVIDVRTIEGLIDPHHKECTLMLIDGLS